MSATTSVQAQAKPALKPDKPLQQSPGIEGLGNLIKGHALTLDEAIRVALVVNRSLALASANMYIAQGKTSEAYAALNPTLGSALSVIRLNDSVQNKTLTVLDPHNFNKPIGEEVVNSNVQQKLLGVSAVLPVDISGTLRVATRLAKFQETGYRLDVLRTRNQVVSDVKAAFYETLRAIALVGVADENLKNSKDRLTDAENRLAARVVTKFDVLRAQTDVAAAKQSVIVAQNSSKTDLALLNLTIGLKVDTQISVSEAGAVTQPGTAETPIDPVQVGLGAEFNNDLKEALDTRPEIQEASTFMDAAKEGIILAAKTELPSLNLSWSYLYAPNAGGTSPLYHTWQAQALFSVPIFDGGVSKARRQEAQGTLAGAQILKRQAVDQVTLEVEQAYLSVDEARQRVAVADQSLKQASEAFSLAKVRYKAGVSARAGISPLLELSDAQSALTLAETNRVNALYDFNSANARLDRALGRYAKQP